MLTFRVDDMTCGHCASAITRAVHVLKPGATVAVDLAQRLVSVGVAEVEAKSVMATIRHAGYSPVQLMASPTPAQAPKKAGCCCGSGRSSCKP